MQKRLVIIFKYSFFLAAGILLVWWSLHKMSDKDCLGDDDLGSPILILQIYNALLQEIQNRMLD